MNIIVPAHNEATYILPCIETLTKLYPDDTITIATDGNTDATTEIAQEQELTYLKLIVQSYPERMGKGAAIKQAIIFGETNAFIDADLAVNPKTLKTMKYIADHAHGLVVAKRHTTNRSKTRTLTSKLYNGMVRLLFRTGIKDHQCGCKVLSVEASAIASICRANDFFFDTELIIRCKQAKIPITEYNVLWTEHKKQSTVNVTRTAIQMLRSLLAMRFAIKQLQR